MARTINSKRSASGSISLTDYRNLTSPPPANNKFKARKTTVDGITFDSAGEANRYEYLRLLQRAGKISDLKRQVAIPLIVNGTHIAIANKLGHKRRLNYVADFTYAEAGATIIEDFKGCDTPLSRLKRSIVEAITGQAVRVSK